MEEEGNNVMKTAEKELIFMLEKYALNQPVVGLIISIFMAIICLIYGVRWSWLLLGYILLPFIFHLLMQVCCCMVIKILYGDKKKLHVAGNNKLIYCLLLILLGLIMTIYFLSPNDHIETIQSKELQIVKGKGDNGHDKTCIIFSSVNCIYCAGMEKVYKESYESYFSKKNEPELYYCDLSNESPYSDEIE